jgi:hypothetical protein
MTAHDKHQAAVSRLLEIAGLLEALCERLVNSPYARAANIDAVVELESQLAEAGRALAAAKDELYREIRAERGCVSPAESLQ